MDYELTAVGVSRLAESTPDERRNSTEKVIKNLEEHNGYYTSLITYETNFRNTKKKPSFKKWLAEQDQTQYKEVKRGDTTPSHKDDKMTEPKYDKKEYTVALKETINSSLSLRYT